MCVSLDSFTLLTLILASISATGLRCGVASAGGTAGAVELVWTAVGEEEWVDLLPPGLPPGEVELDVVS